MSFSIFRKKGPLDHFARGLLLLLGAWLCLLTWQDAWQTRQDYLRLEQESVTCQATVTDKVRRRRSRGSLIFGDERHRLEYDYRDPSGLVHSDSIAVSRPTFDSYEVGDTFSVAVDPARPQANRPSFAEPPLLILFGMGTACLLTLAIGCWEWWLCLSGLGMRARPGEAD